LINRIFAHFGTHVYHYTGVFVGQGTTKKSAADILTMPSVDYAQFCELLTRSTTSSSLLVQPELQDEPSVAAARKLLSLDPASASQFETELKYSAYLKRQHSEIDSIRAQESMEIPPRIRADFAVLPALSNEEREKLARHQPTTIGAAQRISGITPATVVYLHGMCKKHYNHLRRLAEDRRPEAKEIKL
jgi:tRNA U34 5-carboxymethylaminomethyl modifying enzyme MnmG/GidA